ncbi:MAG: hypothetical protein SNJ74_02345 [Fimbriimonadaceae bacterium]
MGLRIATTACFLAGIGLLGAWPWLVGNRPSGPEVSRAMLEAYAVRLSVYMVAILLLFFLTAVFALLTVRRARLEYRDQARANLQELIEGTLRDHERKARPDE